MWDHPATPSVGDYVELLSEANDGRVERVEIVEAEHLRAATELAKRRPALDGITRELLTHETLQRAELEAMVLGRAGQAPSNGA